MIRKTTAIFGALALSLAASAAMAQSGAVSIPGLFSAEGSKGSTIKNSTISVSGNTARNVTAGGGSLQVGAADLSLEGVANVNSINITGSEVTDSTISVSGNDATDINAIGGTANVNSININ